MPPDKTVAPLDAYATAKPDEPTFTLQGGDPLAPPLVRLWSLMARIRAGIFSEDGAARFLTDWTKNVQEVAKNSSLADNEREVENLLVRATAAEEQSWRMDSYQKGYKDEPIDKPTEAGDGFDELERIDLHDARVHAASKINNAAGELNEILTELLPRWFASGREDAREELANIIAEAISLLQSISEEIEPRRLMQRSTEWPIRSKPLQLNEKENTATGGTTADSPTS